MTLRKYLLAGGLSTVLVLGACGGDGGSEEETSEKRRPRKRLKTQVRRQLLRKKLLKGQTADPPKMVKSHIPVNMETIL